MRPADAARASQRGTAPAGPFETRGCAAADHLVAAVDIGGTKVAGGLVDRGGELVHAVREPTPAGGDAEAVEDSVFRVLDRLAAHPHWARVNRLGIGSAGPVDTARGTVSPVNIPAWRDFPLTARIGSHRAAVGLPVVLGGDAIAMTAAEHWVGAARGFTNVMCVVVSTGVGAGLVLDDRVYTGLTGNAGHLGHMCVDVHGARCPCGGRGCLERMASGTAIAAWALDNGWTPAGDDASAAAVAVAARSGNDVALAAFDRAARALAAGIAATATLVELQAVVIGGGVAHAGAVLLDPLRRHLGDYAALPFTHGIEILPAGLGTDAGLVGAAALALVTDGVR